MSNLTVITIVTIIMVEGFALIKATSRANRDLFHIRLDGKLQTVENHTGL
jgi:hypothetical protein